MNGSVIKQFKNTNWKYTLYRMSVFAIFAYFFLKMVFFAVSIGQGIPPDEITHFGRVSAFSKSLFIPHDSPLTYEYGIMKGQPYLYYWVMGKILKLNIFKIDDLVFLRLCNALIGLLTVIVSFLWFRMISGNYLTLLLFLVLLTNTLMFTFICSSVSYDNLTNLASIFSVYLLSKAIKSRELKYVLLAGITLSAGMLVKVTFLPFAVLLFIIILVFLIRNRKHFHAEKAFSPKMVIYWLGLLFLVILNSGLYGVNILRYMKLTPDYEQVVSLDQAFCNRIYARSKIYTLFIEDRISYKKAIEMTSVIHHKGDSLDAVNFINWAQNRKINGFAYLDRISYIPQWCAINVQRIYGLLGHLCMWKKNSELVFYFLFLIAGIIAVLRKWKMQDDKLLLLAMGVSVFYLLVLMQYVGYSSYRLYAHVGAEIQGRYVFPVLPLLYGVISYYIMSMKSILVRTSLFIVTGYFFIAGEFPYFLSNAYSAWFMK